MAPTLLRCCGNTNYTVYQVTKLLVVETPGNGGKEANLEIKLYLFDFFLFILILIILQ